MENKFQSKTYPQGSRTLWRYLGALFILFTFAIGQMWGADITVTPPTPNNASNPFSTGLYVMSFSGTDSKLSSGAITTGTKGAVITINFQATKSDMYIKTITFNSLGNGTLSSDDGTFDGQVFTATGNKNSVNVVLTSGSGQKGTVKVTNVVVNTGTNVVETITFTGVDSGDGKKATFTSSAATSALSSITTDASAFSVSSGKLSWANGKKVILTAESNIKYVAFSIADGKMYDSFSAAETTYNSANYSWSGSSKTVTLTNGSGGGREIKGLYVIIDPVVKHHVTYSLGGDYGTTPTQADVAEGAKFTLHNGTTGITAPAGKQFGGWNDGATTYAGGAEYTMGTSDVTLTAVWENAKTDPTATFSAGAYVVGESALDLSTLWSSNSDGAVTYALKVASEDATVSGTSFSATKAGSYVVTASQAATATYNAVVKEATITVTWPATGAATITYNLDVTNNGTTLQTLATTNANSSSISVSASNSLLAGGLGTGGSHSADKNKHNGTRTLGINTLAEETADKYFYVTFTVASGHEFTPSAISLKTLTIGGNATSYKAVLTDGVNNIVGTVNATNDSEVTLGSWTGLGTTTLSGTVTLKLYAWYTTSGTYNAYRLSTPLTITGTVAEVDVTAPTFVSSVPADEATGIDVSGNIVLTMSENVSVADASKFSLTGGAGSLTTGSITVSGAVITIPYTGLDNNTDYTFTAAAGAIKDGSNNLNAAFTIGFKTAASGVCVKPDAPIGLGVDVKTNNYAKFSWDGGSAGANGYQIALTSEAVGATGKFDWKDEATAIYEATNLTPATEYTFKVKYKGTVDDCFSDEVTETFTTYSVCTELVPETSGDSPSAIGEEIRLQGGSTGGKIYVADNKAGKTLAESFTYTANGISLNTGGQDSLRVELSSLMKVGTVISAEIYNANDDKARGLLLKNMSKTTKATWTTTMTGTHYETYTVVAGDGLEGSNMFLLSRSETAALKSLTVSNCGDAIYDVIFDMKGHGTQVAKQTLTAGAKVAEPSEPEEAGYIFGGWYKETTLENAWNFSTDVVPSNDITLYAKWTEDPCTDRQSLSKVVLTSASEGTVTGYNGNEYAGTAIIASLKDDGKTADIIGDATKEKGYKLNSSGNSIVMATLKKGDFQEGDKVTVGVILKNDQRTVDASTDILTLYAGSDKDHMMEVATIKNVSDPGFYTYRLTAANATAINAAGYKSIGLFRASSNGENHNIYSVEITGCREWTIFHTLTFKNIDGTATIAAEPLEEGAAASTVAPIAPKIAMKRFLGWAEAIDGTPVELTSYTITEDKTLYAVYEDIVCPTNGTVYKFEIKDELPSENLPTSTDKDMSSYITATGDGYLTYTATANNKATINNNGTIQLKDATAAYLKVELACAMAAGDQIRANVSNNPIRVQVGTTYDADKDLILAKDVYNTVDITSAMEGKKVLYIARSTNGNANLADFEVYRRPVLTGVTLSDAIVRVGATGTPSVTLLPAEDAIVTGQAWTIEGEGEGTIADINESTGVVTGIAAGDVTVKVVMNGDPAIYATATVHVVNDYARQDVTGSISWSWDKNGALSGTTAQENVNVNETLLANVGTMPNNADFQSDKLVTTCQHAYRPGTGNGCWQGTEIKFYTTVPGAVTVNYMGTGNSDNVTLSINNWTADEYAGGWTDSKTIVVPSGWVTISAAATNTLRIKSITFDAALDPTKTQEEKYQYGGYERTTTQGRIGTICLPKAGVMVGADLFEVAYYGETSQKVFLDQIVNGEMEAGVPYFFLPKEGAAQLGVYYTGTAVEPAGTYYTDGTTPASTSKNGLIGFIGASAEEYYDIPAGAGNYIIQNNQYREVPAGAWARVQSNRAYFRLADITLHAPMLSPGRHRLSIGINAPQVTTGLDELNVGDTPVKVMIDGNLYILRGENMYDATGRLVK